MADSKLVKANAQIAKAVTEGFQKIEDGVVGTYKKVEDSVVGAYKKVEDKFVGSFLTRDGESVEEAKQRLAAEQTARSEEAAGKTEKP